MIRHRLRSAALVLAALFISASAFATGEVIVYPESLYTSGALCVLSSATNDSTNGYRTFDCTGTQMAFTTVPIPSGGSLGTVKGFACFKPVDTTAKTCSWKIGILAQVNFCVGTTTSATVGGQGYACRSTADCASPDTCIGGTGDGLTDITNAFLATRTTTATVTAGAEVCTDVTATASMVRARNTTTSAQAANGTTPCVGAECNGTKGKLYMQAYSTSADATSCKLTGIWLIFP